MSMQLGRLNNERAANNQPPLDALPPKKWGKSRTKEAFKDSCDINKIVKRAQREGSLAHALKYPAPVYAEFQDVDLLSAYEQIGRAQAIFDDLPSEVKNEFGHDAFKFAAYASDPANVDRLTKLLPALAEPGRQWPKSGDEPIAVRVVPEAPQGGEGDPGPTDAAKSAPGASDEGSGDPGGDAGASSDT